MRTVENRLRERAQYIAVEDQDYSELLSFETKNHSSYLTARAEFASGRVIRLRSDQNGNALRS